MSAIPDNPHDDLEEEAIHDSNRYGIAPGIAGVLLALGLIWFMFALADGFS